jgi:hypothetical protein
MSYTQQEKDQALAVVDRLIEKKTQGFFLVFEGGDQSVGNFMAVTNAKGVHILEVILQYLSRTGFDRDEVLRYLVLTKGKNMSHTVEVAQEPTA